MATDYFALGGGLDLVSPALSIKPGRVIVAENYECDYNGGYRRVRGLERFDGRLAPSEATFRGLLIKGTAASLVLMPFVPGQTVTGATSGATGVVHAVSTSFVADQVQGISVPTLDAGEYYAVVTFISVTGAFLRDEVVTVTGGSAVAVYADRPTFSGNEVDYKATQEAAEDARRALILAVPGQGPVRGVWRIDGVVYAVRDFSDTVAKIYGSSPAGWSEVPLGFVTPFDAGSGGVNDLFPLSGETLTGTGATLLGIQVTDGGFDSDDAKGFIYTDLNPGLNNNTLINFSGGAVAMVDGVGTTNALLPGGRFETVTNNFYGATDRRRVYCCDGVNKAFEFNPTGIVFITTGMVEDKPRHIEAHRNVLHLSFRGGSLQRSAVGDPFAWTAVLGAAEIATGDEITALCSMPEVLAVFSRNRTDLLYGNDESDLELKPHSKETGCIEYTMQTVGPRPYFLDDRGIGDLGAVQAFGNFVGSMLSTDIDPLLNLQRRLVVGSLVVRERSLYRLFFSDGSVITMTLKGTKAVGFMPQRYPFVLSCSWTGENETGDDTVLVGATDGFVYQMEKGNSFDGESIPSFLRLSFNNLRTPRMRKRFKTAVFEMETRAATTLRVIPEFSYSSINVPAARVNELDLSGGGGFWDAVNFIWDQFIWDGPPITEMRADIDGIGTNVSLLVYGDEREDFHTLQGVILNWEPRRLEK